jgi:predicted nicotinamide N-methyase
MNVTDEDVSERFRLREEVFVHDRFATTIRLPDSSEDLIDEAEFGHDERLPYWAELWPAARSLARLLLDEPTLPPRAIELGCGVALPSLALRSRRVEVLATDYYDDALLFARYNARINGTGELPTRLLDWRHPPADLGRFPLAVAADVLYEERNVQSLLSLLPSIVEKGGQLLLADPERIHLGPFLEGATATGWKVEHLPDRMEDSPAGQGIRIRIRLIRLRRP